MLAVRGLRKRYGEVLALDGVSLDVAPGEILGLLGPNGAGKTTLVSIVAGLRRADEGSVEVAGIDVAAHPHQVRSRIGLAPQDLGIYPIVTVRQNLALFGEIAGLSGARLPRRIEEVADALGISPLLDRLAGTLSGGEKRRLHTAIALLHEPPLLLLDEPTTGADVRTRQDLLAVVRDLAARGSAILYSTHYLAEVESLGASVAILEEGRLIARGSVEDLIGSHARAAVELTFDGPPPELELAGEVAQADSRLTISTDDPASTAVQALAALGSSSRRLRSVQIINPSLESVYLALTGRRYSGEDFDAPEVVDVAQS